ncbi:sulfur carrier protein ThiS [Sulfurovum sp.]|uniref:sulfur carrier protein ThiS n=1 Tax=Sulfurovum sp. TaxID=1969726 RepID=UPI0025FA88E7|nr:sulfur carrier protein ThiS [Sulfurovum sp.]
MTIIVNGESKQIADQMSIAELITFLGFSEKIGAVACNMTFVPSDSYEKTFLSEGDEVEILAPVCGG